MPLNPKSGIRGREVSVFGINCNKNHVLLISVLIVVLEGCALEKKGDLVVVSKTVKKEKAASTAAPMEFGLPAASVGYSFWVEGKVKNEGDEAAKNVEVTFRCKHGGTVRILTAKVNNIPASKTVDFKTRIFPSKVDLQLLDEEPEIKYD